MPTSKVKITYDNWSTNNGIAPWGPSIPYIQFNRNPIFAGGKWGQVVEITLTGKIGIGTIAAMMGLPAGWHPNYPHGLDVLNQVRDNIIEAFSVSLKTFEFEDSETPPNAMSFPNTVVESVDFPSSGYHAFLDFSVKLKAYEQDYFMGQGVVDPVDEFTTTENEDGTLTVSHTISARGVDYTASGGGTTHNGLTNAIAWVNSRKGGSNRSEEGLSKAWHGGTKTGYANPSIYLILLEQNELINRLQGTYEVSETFIGYLDEANNLQNTPYGVRYSVDINESLGQDFNIVTISGDFKGGQDTTLQDMRNAIPSEQLEVTGLYAMARKLSKYDGAGGRETLYSIATDFSLDENETDKSIKIKATFDTNPLFVKKDENGELQPSRYYFDHKISIDVDDITKISKVSINGELVVRGLYTERSFYIKQFFDTKDVMDFLWEKADASHKGFMNICHECSGAGDNYWVRVEPGEDPATKCSEAEAGGAPTGGSPERCHELGPHAETISISTQTYGEEYGKVSMSATFTDADFLILGSGKPYGKCSYNVDVEAPIDLVKANASAQKKYNGHWAIQKLGMKTREKSTAKVSLNFREDSGVAQDDMEGILRVRAEELLEDLNNLLDQHAGDPQYDTYDVDKNINTKEAKTDSISATIKRSYIPDEDKAICVDLPESESGKNCYNCIGSNGLQTGNSVYAEDTDSAQTECDKKSSGLTPSPCDQCYRCYEGGEPKGNEFYASSLTEAQSICSSGQTAQECELVEKTCWKCADYGDPTIHYGSDVWAATQLEAQNVCDQREESTAIPCPDAAETCWKCIKIFPASCPSYADYGFNTEQECIDDGNYPPAVIYEEVYATFTLPTGTSAEVMCRSVPGYQSANIRVEECVS